MDRDDQPTAFSVRQFCEMHAIGRTTFYEEVKYGRLRIRKLGKRTLVLREEAERWVSALPSPESRFSPLRHRKSANTSAGYSRAK
ncbi:hypothetical protein [uncultured Brevundimonas sp.]|uniref:hypothetical protein n=1 Tax=uncultured Brevundimonas sp. TaxID=213418 RepID=UPI0025FD5853|nr:hypothetical protein [uncultured Brevundimonas sp.]